MARPAKISSDDLIKYMSQYIDIRTVSNGIVQILNRNDADIAAEISQKTGININRNQIVYFRRKYNIAACRENWGGEREGAGRKQEHIAVSYDGSTIIVDYAGGYAAVQLLHILDTFRLSREWIPNMTDGDIRPKQKARIKELSSILKEMHKKNSNIEELREKASQVQKRIPQVPGKIQKMPMAAGAEDIQEIFESAANIRGNGKTTKGGGKTSVASGQYFGN